MHLSVKVYTVNLNTLFCSMLQQFPQSWSKRSLMVLSNMEVPLTTHHWDDLGVPNFHPHSLPEYHDSLVNGLPFNSPGTMASMSRCISSVQYEVVDINHMRQVGAVYAHNSLVAVQVLSDRYMTGMTYITRLTSGEWHPREKQTILSCHKMDICVYGMLLTSLVKIRYFFLCHNQVLRRTRTHR